MQPALLIAMMSVSGLCGPKTKACAPAPRCVTTVAVCAPAPVCAPKPKLCVMKAPKLCMPKLCMPKPACAPVACAPAPCAPVCKPVKAKKCGLFSGLSLCHKKPACGPVMAAAPCAGPVYASPVVVPSAQATPQSSPQG